MSPAVVGRGLWAGLGDAVDAPDAEGVEGVEGGEGMGRVLLREAVSPERPRRPVEKLVNIGSESGKRSVDLGDRTHRA
jgi:hypothetical protein